MAHCSTSNTCCNRHAPSRHRCHQQPALFSATDPTDCRLVSRWPPHALPPVVGNKSSALDGAGSLFHFEALFFFLRAVVGFNLGCVAAADSTESDSRHRCPRDAQRWLRTALAIVMLGSACCVSTAQGTWSTAQLSVGRESLAATSVGNVAIFAGGDVDNCSLTLLMCVGDGVTSACLRRAACCFVVHAVQEVAV
jgi:hypothetical protein